MAFKLTRTPYIDVRKIDDGKTVTFDLSQDASIYEMLEAFEGFLKACGYSFDGPLEIGKKEVKDEH